MEIKNAIDISVALKQLVSEFNAQKADVFGAVTAGVRAKVLDGKPDERSASQKAGLTLRVWNNNGGCGVASVTGTNFETLSAGFKSAMLSGDLLEIDSNVQISNQIDMAQNVKKPTQFSKVGQNFSSFEAMTSWLLESEKQIRASHKLISAVPYNGVSQDEVCTFYINTEGSVQENLVQTCVGYFYTKTSGEKSRSAGDSVKFRTFEEVKSSAVVQKVIEKTLHHIQFADIESGLYKVVFAPEAVLQLISAFQNFFNGQLVLDGRSLSTKESLGQKIACEELTIEDNVLHVENISASSFDSEGSKSKRTIVVKNGVLESFIHSSISAKKMNTTSTGNGRLGSKVTAGARYLSVLPGKFDLKKFKNDGEKFVFIEELNALHAGVNELQGSFSLPFSGSYFDGKKMTSIELATVAGDFMTTLQRIVGVGNEVETLMGGLAPCICVDSLSITSGSAK